MQMNTYLNFNGQCEAAFKFYEKCLGGKITMLSVYGDSPMVEHAPAEWRNKVIHARMTVGDTVLMGSDPPPDRYVASQGFSMSLGAAEPEEAERLFHALAENGQIQMPIQKTFWSMRFGMLTDQFGIPWMVNCDQAPEA